MDTHVYEQEGLRIAVEGCGHGTLNAIYASIEKSCEINSWDGVDLLIIGGDFQAVRNSFDLNCMSVPMKFREIGDFHEYYSGTRIAPYLTIFVGGNHEASNHLWELYYGGWVAPNIYYLGAANVVRLGPLRIVGLSGIWKGYNYKKPHHERLPYNQDDVKSSYHVRELDVRKLLQIRTQVDVGISHDWPRAVEWKGNWKDLFMKKDGFEADAKAGTLGSLAAKYVMDRLRPAHWFSAHLHVKFSAVIEHEKDTRIESQIGLATGTTNLPFSNGSNPRVNAEARLQLGPNIDPIRNDEEIEIDMDDDEVDISPVANCNANSSNNQDEISLTLEDDEVANTTLSAQQDVPEDLRAQLPASFSQPALSAPQPRLPPPASICNKSTRFLALDKCLPNRRFLQILEVKPISIQTNSTSAQMKPLRLEYDKEWLAITRVFASELHLGEPSSPVPANKGEAYYKPLIEEQEQWVEEHIVIRSQMMIPENFEITAPVYDPAVGIRTTEGPKEYTNPQTAQYCNLLGIENSFHASDQEREQRINQGPKADEPRMGGGRGRGRFRGGRGARDGARGGGRGGGRGRRRGGR
ncbi:MAG: hypothetical protein M1827_002500 [Pycnora praestabilis]|nr:MAG: hypothetical protein M1827_002500 [Pycnora praestabilis]